MNKTIFMLLVSLVLYPEWPAHAIAKSQALVLSAKAALYVDPSNFH